MRKVILLMLATLLAGLLPELSVHSLFGQGRKVNTNVYTPPSIRERYANQPVQRPQVPHPQPNLPQQNPALANLPVTLKIRYDDDRVTAEVRNAPIQQALEELAARTGIVFEVSSIDNDPVSVSLFRVSLQEAVQRVVGPGNSIAYFGKDESGRERLLFVRVLARKNPNAPTSLRYLGIGAITKTGEDVVETPDQAIKALASSDDVDLRQKAIETLAASKSDVAAAALTIALDDPAPEVRVASIEGLASLGARPVLPKIVALLKDEHPGVRRSAIVAIALLGDTTSLRDLRPMGKDPDPSVVAEAETAIKKLSTRRP
jgi:hypothetical protein